MDNPIGNDSNQNSPATSKKSPKFFIFGIIAAVLLLALLGAAFWFGQKQVDGLSTENNPSPTPEVAISPSPSADDSLNLDTNTTPSPTVENATGTPSPTATPTPTPKPGITFVPINPQLKVSIIPFQITPTPTPFQIVYPTIKIQIPDL